MKSAAPAAPPAPRAPRPVSAHKRVARAPLAAGATVASETQLRRRLSEVEMHIRDIDDDSKRIQVRHEQELTALEKDNKGLRGRLEELRMEECMTPSEARVMLEHTNLSHGTHGHQVESKLLGATSAKYQTAKAAVEAKREECAAAERQLAEICQQHAELRRRRQGLKQEVFFAKASASAKMAAAQHYKVQVREQLRGLEEQVAREQERFSNLVMEAKEMRGAIDALLVNQTSNEKIYRKRYDALLSKRKEMAYLMEVCNSLCEERQQVNAELQEMRAYLAEENKQYEAAFQELTGVAEENATVQATNRAKIDELRRLIIQTKTEREAMEAQNIEAKAALERQRHHRVGRPVSRRSDNNGEEIRSTNSRSEHSFQRHSSDVNGQDDKEEGDDRSGIETTSCSSAIGFDVHSTKLHMFEDYFQKLASIVQSDAIEDVVGFIDVAAEERYRCFDEMNALKREIAELTAEKAALKEQMMHGGSGAASSNTADTNGATTDAPTATPSTCISALAEVTSIEKLTVAAAAPESVGLVRQSEASSAAPASGVTTSQAAAKRAERMRQLQKELDKTRDAVMEQEQQREECGGVLAQVIAQVNEVFRGLGCRSADLRVTTGMEGVQQRTLLQSLSIVEKRAEEFLLAYAQSHHSQKKQSQEQHALKARDDGAVSTTHAGSHNAARTVLRRPDLPPKTKDGAAAQVSSQQLPRSTDVTVMVPHVNVADAAHLAMLEELVEERPLSDAELREVVDAKRALAHH